MAHTIAGFAADALNSLSASQVEFLQRLPKAELHAHLNGSIPLPVLRELAYEFLAENISNPAHDVALPDLVRTGVEQLQRGVVLGEIHQFFALFPAIYALTSTPDALRRAAHAVLGHFLSCSDGYPQAAYLELRTTPRETPSMNRLRYLEVVLDEVEKYPREQAALIVSLDRRMSPAVSMECVEHAIYLKKGGRRVVGIDLCGDPKAGNMDEFAQQFRTAKEAGLGITLHIAETEDCPAAETLQLLSYEPDRLGHATFLDEAAKKIVHTKEMCIEICLSSNLLCKTVPTLDDHHIRYYLGHDHPIVVCTDDILPFRNSLLGEYALLMAEPPLGLGLTEPEVEKIARMGMGCRFGQ
ncbi:Adenosine deaminase-like protein [Grifola frondosa]|uniref:Adenosine deaminase-like protein n=1 Tax=Grifola frondosa TaxID=5627 RepID=A0A1C7MRY2_GRIFR|nr:Adenosine deaminase-like protein [Grifola frondosa]